MIVRPRPHEFCACDHTGREIFANCRSIVRFATVHDRPTRLHRHAVDANELFPSDVVAMIATLEATPFAVQLVELSRRRYCPSNEPELSMP